MLLLWCHEGIGSVFVDTLCAYLLALATSWPQQVTSSFLSSTHLAAARAADADHGVVVKICQQKAVAPDVGFWFSARLDMTPTFFVPAHNTMVFSRKISEVQIVLLCSSEDGPIARCTFLRSVRRIPSLHSISVRISPHRDAFCDFASSHNILVPSEYQAVSQWWILYGWLAAPLVACCKIAEEPSTTRMPRAWSYEYQATANKLP